MKSLHYSNISELLIEPDPFIKTENGFIHTSYSLLSFMKNKLNKIKN